MSVKVVKYVKDLQVCKGFLVHCGLTSHSRIFRSSCGEALQNLGLRYALMAFEQGRVFIVPHLQ